MAAKKKGKRSNTVGISSMLDNKWRTESDLRILQDAREIRRDPKRMKAAQELAAERLKDLGTIVGDSDE